MDKDIARREVLRYLGHSRQEIPADLSALIDECMGLMRDASKPRYVKRVFAIEFLPDGVHIKNADSGAGSGLVLRGGDIARHLSKSSSAAVFAATLGVEADNLIRMQRKTVLTRSLILDACATQLIEEHCGEIEAQIRAEASASGLTATGRFSPGYGDFPLEIQPMLLAVLGAEKQIGLTCTESLILLPRKSVTAVMGLGGVNEHAGHGRRACGARDSCVFRRDDLCDECS